MSAVQSAHEILLHRDTTANLYKIWWITTLNATDPDSLLCEGLSHVALSMIVLNVRGHSLSKPTCSTHVCKFQSPFVELLELFGVTPSLVQNFSENSIEDNWSNWRLPGRRFVMVCRILSCRMPTYAHCSICGTRHPCRSLQASIPRSGGFVEDPKCARDVRNDTIVIWLWTMDQYLLIPFLVGWTSIYQLFWCSPGVQGFDTLPYIVIHCIILYLNLHECSTFQISKALLQPEFGVWQDHFQDANCLAQASHCFSEAGEDSMRLDAQTYPTYPTSTSSRYQ